MKETVIIRAGSYRAEFEPSALSVLPLVRARRMFKLLKEGEAHRENVATKARLNELLQAQEDYYLSVLQTVRTVQAETNACPLPDLDQQEDRIIKTAHDLKRTRVKYRKAKRLNTAFHEITD